MLIEMRIVIIIVLYLPKLQSLKFWEKNVCGQKGVDASDKHFFSK
jgi:hypothetical protein